MSVLSACIEQELIAAPSGNALVVHAVLDPASRDQVVAVQFARGSPERMETVVGATVLLALPDGRRVQAAEAAPSTSPAAASESASTAFVYHFALDELGFELVPGGTYQLEVRVPDGRIVSGHTTIPLAQPSSLDAPTEQMRSHGDTLHLRWARIAGARGYEVSVFNQTQNFTRVNSVFADTTLDITPTLHGRNGDTFLFPGTENKIAVMAVDSNYYDYYRRDSDSITGNGLITHLTGAEGVFASVVPIAARSVKLVF